MADALTELTDNTVLPADANSPDPGDTPNHAAAVEFSIEGAAMKFMV
jgi:hypothetical protein